MNKKENFVATDFRGFHTDKTKHGNWHPATRAGTTRSTDVQPRSGDILLVQDVSPGYAESSGTESP